MSLYWLLKVYVIPPVNHWIKKLSIGFWRSVFYAVFFLVFFLANKRPIENTKTIQRRHERTRWRWWWEPIRYNSYQRTPKSQVSLNIGAPRCTISSSLFGSPQQPFRIAYDPWFGMDDPNCRLIRGERFMVTLIRQRACCGRHNNVYYFWLEPESANSCLHFTQFIWSIKETQRHGRWSNITSLNSSSFP